MNVLQVTNAQKKFGTVVALDGASFDLRQGELEALPLPAPKRLVETMVMDAPPPRRG